MDLPIQKGKHGFIGLRDFSGMILRAMCGISEDEAKLIDEIRGILAIPAETGAHDERTYKRLKMWLDEKEAQMKGHAGFIYHDRVTIWKNPVTEMQRTKALGLLHKQLKKNAAMSRTGIPDYILTFRKDGIPVNPVSVDIPVDLWQKWASPVWMDIDYGDTLNRNEAREEKDEKHIAPLQLPTIERLIGLYTNPGDLVLTPFGGIFSEIYQAVKMGRRGLAFELKKQYFDVGVKNMQWLEMEKKQLDIFSMMPTNEIAYRQQEQQQKNIPDGAHFWAMVPGSDEKIVLIKRNGDYFVAGNWEGNIPESEFVFIEMIEEPDAV
jgi:hypothetical protein